MNGLLVRQSDVWKNIGDYIQSLAQAQYWDHIDTIVDREHLDEVSSDEKINVIMNSWWMWNPESFPPSDSINPFFISFHISPHIADRMLSERAIAYLKKYEPIGARDYGTVSILEKSGIKSYFSACLTLTLGKSYHSNDKDNSIYIIDPECPVLKRGAVKDWIRSLLGLFIYRKQIRIINPKFLWERATVFQRISKKLNKKICTLLFYQSYRKFFSDDVLLNAHYLSHIVNVEKDYPSNESCLAYAEELIKLYAKAKMVITSRIHAALPCLGLGTPVFFIRSRLIDAGAISGRLDGLLDFINYRFSVIGNDIVPATKETESLVKKGRISRETQLKNSESFYSYRDDLIRRTSAFVQSCNNEVR